MPEPRAMRLAVLIDADNIPASYAEAIFEEIATLGEASVRRVYGDWSDPRLRPWKDREAALGLVADQQSSNTKGKNASDIGLVIAAMDFLHSGRFDGFVLVSSDSDFTRLASRIREEGLDVYGIGQQKTPEAFRKACKRFIFVENLMAAPEPAASSPIATVPAMEQAAVVAKTAARARRPVVAAASVSAAARIPVRSDLDQLPAFITDAPVMPSTDTAETVGRKEPAAKAVPLILRALKSMNSDEEWIGLGQLGQYIATTNPDFDPRTYGSPKLSELLRKTGQFEVKQGAGNHLIMRPVPDTRK